MKSCAFFVMMVLTITLIIQTFSTQHVGVHAHMFGTKDGSVEELTPETIGKFLSTHKAVYLAIYAPWCGHCKALVNPWQEAAKSMKGTVKFGAIDADKYKEIGQRFGVQGFPTIKKWGMGPKKGKQPNDYQGARSAGAIQKDALSEIKHKTTVATTSQQVVEAISKTSLKKAFVLFTNKDKVAPLYNVLSFSPHYENKIAFVVVKTQNKKNAADLLSSFGTSAPKVPSMQVVSLTEDGSAIDTSSLQEYTGKVEYNEIAKFLLELVNGGGGASSGDAETGGAEEKPQEKKQQKSGGEEKQKEPKQPAKRALPVTVTALSNEAIQDFCSGNAQGRKQPFCVVVFENPKNEGANAADVFKTFAADSVLVFTGNEAALSAASRVFNNGAPGTSSALKSLVFRTTEKKVTKYVWVDGSRNQDLEDGITRVLDGTTKTHKSDEGVFKL